MELYVLKSSVCLVVLFGFYKLFLERENMHVFKRFYLLTALIVAFSIPFITFTQYVEATPILETLELNISEGKTLVTQTQNTNYLLYVLWYFYGLGALFFGIKFIVSLFKIAFKIKQNPKLKKGKTINVLLQESIIPHTFFNYIFLNKQKFEHGQIPKEVMLHEQTHAEQKHSIDILLVELIQVIFWFNPLIYLVKHAIKLNHEFLADKAVLNNGVDTSIYQKTLLAFSSNAQCSPMANAINYSLIKKRFTIMKTQTSKKTIWIRSFILLPILAILIYSFSSKNVVEKDTEAQTSTEELLSDDESSNTKHTARSITIEVLNDGNYIVDNIRATKNTFKTVVNTLHQDITAKERNKIINIHINSSYEISNEEVWFIYNSLLEYGFHRIVTDSQEVIRSKGNIPFAIEDKNLVSPKEQTTNTTQEILPTINGKTCSNCEALLRLKELLKINIGTNTKETVTRFKFKVPGNPTVVVKGNKLNFKAIEYAKKARNNDLITIFDITTKSKKLNDYITIFVTDGTAKSSKINTEDLKNIPPPPPPPPISPKATPAQKTKQEKVISNYKKRYTINKGEVSNIPPPPAPPKPKSPLDHVIDMAKKGAKFSYNGKSITSDQAIALLKKNSELNISSKTKNGISTVNIQDEPITIKN